MPNIRVKCPACEKALEVSDEHAGQEVECSECLQVFVAEKPRGKKLPAASPAKPPPRRRDDDEDDYEHDRRRDDDYEPPRRRRGGGGGSPPCSRLVYILLALFLGTLGIHNFYAGRMGPGAAQLVITAVSIPLMCAGIGLFTIWLPVVWALIDIVTVTRDGRGRWME